MYAETYLPWQRIFFEYQKENPRTRSFFFAQRFKKCLMRLHLALGKKHKRQPQSGNGGFSYKQGLIHKKMALLYSKRKLYFLCIAVNRKNVQAAHFLSAIFSASEYSTRAQSTLNASMQICGQFLLCCLPPVWTLSFTIECSIWVCASCLVTSRPMWMQKGQVVALRLQPLKCSKTCRSTEVHKGHQTMTRNAECYCTSSQYMYLQW